MIFLRLEDVLHVAERALGHAPEVRDVGLLEAALARLQATAFGEEAYPDGHEKAAALLHSLAPSHPLVDGNKRLALVAALAFYGVNGMRMTLTSDEAYDLVVGVAEGAIDDAAAIAAALRRGTEMRG